MAETVVHEIQRAEPRTSVQVTFPNGAILEGPVGAPLEEFVKAHDDERTGSLPERIPVVAAIVDGLLRELTMPVKRDVSITPVTTDSGDGRRIYRRSLAFLLTVATAELFPGTQVLIDFALPSGAFFCKVRGHGPFTPDELQQIQARMHEIVEASDPI